MDNKWKCIDSIPTDGTFVLVYDKNLKQFDVANKPIGCYIGKWIMNKQNKEWNGSSLPGYFKASYWISLPKPPKKETIFKCSCGGEEFGFNCVCEHIKNNPGTIEYCCSYCGLYTASRPLCGECEEEV
jgi:Protein of unknown function (DUF551)